MSPLPRRQRRFAVYARYSTANQRPASIDDQVRECRKFIERSRGRLENSLVFSDAEASGTNTARSGLSRMLAAAKAHAFDTLVVEDVSRLSRDAADAMEIAKQLAHYGITIVGVHDGVDTSTSQGMLAFRLLAVLAQQYIDHGREKTRRGLEGRAREGHSTGGLPYGYRSEKVLDADGGVVGYRIVIHETRAHVVRRIFRAYVDGASLGRIAKMLNDEAVRSPRPRRQTTTRGWSAGTIRGMLRNEAYVGRWSYGKTEWRTAPGSNKRRAYARRDENYVRREDESLRIVDEETWKRAQDRVAEVRACYTAERDRASSDGRESTHLLSGLLRCGACGGPMTVHSGSSASYYTCSDARKRGTCSNRASVREALVVQAVLGVVRQRISAPSARAYLQQRIVARLREWPKSEADVVRELTVADLDKKIANLVAFLEAGGEAASIRDRLRDLERERNTAREALEHAAVLSKQVQAPAVEGAALDFDQVLSVDTGRARERLRHLFVGQRLLVHEAETGSVVAGRTVDGRRLRLVITRGMAPAGRSTRGR